MGKEMNPMKLMQLKGLLEQFRQNHPKALPFLEAANAALDEGTLIEVEIRTSQGKKLYTNIRVNATDLEILRKLQE